ncbi:MAG: hypothetical protein MK033_12000 [Candidatus Caenarcaniphilales bacterium]|nr:hypothetical protein [Candidatus Caenarcaniphilales bacterium]
MVFKLPQLNIANLPFMSPVKAQQNQPSDEQLMAFLGISPNDLNQSLGDSLASSGITPSTNTSSMGEFTNNTELAQTNWQQTGNVQVASGNAMEFGKEFFGFANEEEMNLAIAMAAFEGKDDLETLVNGTKPSSYHYVLTAGLHNRVKSENAKGAKAWGSKDGSVKGLLEAPQQYVVVADIIKPEMAKKGYSALSTREQTIEIISKKFFTGNNKDEAIAKATKFYDAMIKSFENPSLYYDVKKELQGRDSWKASNSNVPAKYQPIKLAGGAGNQYHFS